MSEALDLALVARLWRELSGETPAPPLLVTGKPGGLPSVFQVSALASASVAVATMAVAELWAQRTGEPARTTLVDRRHAAVAFRSERYLQPEGWELPAVWDPLAGDYQTRDGWIRLHTNYAHHREAALRVLGACEHAADVARAVRSCEGAHLEAEIVGQGGCAAVMHSRDVFSSSPAGRALRGQPLVALHSRPASRVRSHVPAERPLTGLRVLDLTRVIAGPVCTRFLAAYGADVLRLDPPGFEEMPVLLREITQGKRRAALDLRTPHGREVFAQLVAQADLLVVGYRADALDKLGFGAAWQAEVQPALCVVTLNAYGFMGPWAARRGFDSLVQMSCGIAERGQAALRSERPVSLPAQALDHATGYLAAAAACRALTQRFSRGESAQARVSLARTAELLWELGTDGDPHAPGLASEEVTAHLERVDTVWGRLSRVRCPGELERLAPCWSTAPGPLGSDAPRFASDG